jgi:hypothetical protein
MDDDQVVALGQRKDGVHVGGLPIQMYRDHRRDRTPASLADQPTGIILGASIFQVLLQLGGIEVVRVLVDIDEFRQRTCLRNRFGGGNEGVRHGYDHVTLPDPAGD